MAGTTSPDWRFSLRDPRGVADECGQYSPEASPSNVNTTTPGTITAFPSPNDTLIHIRRRDSRSIGHIYQRHIMKPPGFRSDVRYEYSDTVQGPTGQHPDQFGVLVKRPQAQDVWDD